MGQFMKEQKVEDLMNLGKKSTECLKEIGIFTKSDLIEFGPIEAYVKLKQEAKILKPSLNLLYAMVGAVQDVHWLEIAKNHKDELIEQIEGYRELDEEMKRMLG